MEWGSNNESDDLDVLGEGPEAQEGAAEAASHCGVCGEASLPLRDCDQCSRFACRSCIPIYRMICCECTAKNEAEAAENPPPRAPARPKGTFMRRINWNRCPISIDLNEKQLSANEKGREDEKKRRSNKAYDDGDWRYKKRTGAAEAERETESSPDDFASVPNVEDSPSEQELAEGSFFQEQCAAATAMMHAPTPDETKSSEEADGSEQEEGSDGNESSEI